MNKAELESRLRDEILSVIATALQNHFDCDILTTGAGEVAIPVLDAEQNEKFGVIKVSIPRGKRSAGGYEPYDGYAAEEEYKFTLEDREEKKTARAEKKARAEIEKEKKRAEKKAQAEAKKAILELKKIKVAKEKTA